MVYIKNKINKKFGKFIAFAGILLMVISLSILGYDFCKDVKAKIASDDLVEEIYDKLSNKENKSNILKINNEEYLGIINIPDIGVELPVANTYSFEKLDYSPAVYSGSIETNDLVICAHNGRAHFANLKKLNPKDKIIIIDANNNKYVYEVCEIIITKPYEIEKMINSEFDLTLFTCTFKGVARLTVRCNRIS